MKSEISKQTKFVSNQKLLVVEIAGNMYGFDLSNVKEIIRMPEITFIPSAPDFIRGMIRLRDAVLPLIDIRKKLGLKSTDDENKEFLEILTAREQDHINWVNELRRCVLEKDDFKLTTDPHACKFGKWYDTFQSSNMIVMASLEKFDLPHKKIHSIGKDAIMLMNNHKYKEALDLVNKTEQKELKELINLFAELKTLIVKSKREFAVIFDLNGVFTSVPVDKIEQIIPIDTSNIEENLSFAIGNFIAGIYKHTSGIYTILNPEALTHKEAILVGDILQTEIVA